MSSTSDTRRDPFVLGLAVAVAIAGVLVHIGIGPADTYWTIDNGGKALALESLLAHPGRPGLDYPGRSLDPELRWFPQPLAGAEPYARVRDGRIVSQYLSPFVTLTWPFARWLGFGGLAVLPALGAGLSVALAGALAARRSGRRAGRTAAAVLALASPLLFYGSVLWEHTLAAALATGALLALTGATTKPPRPMLAGLLVGATVLLREETALLAIALVLVLALTGGRRELPRFVAGLVPGLLALALFQKLATGAWGGVRLDANQPVPLVHAGAALRGLLLDPGASGLPILAALVPLVLLAAARLAPPDGRTAPALRTVGLAGLATVSALALARFPGGEDEALALIGSNSALVFLPWTLALAFLPRRQPAPHDPLDRVVLAFVALFVLLVPERSITGIHPAPRMLLVVLPAAAVIAAERFPAGRLPAGAFLVTLLLGGAWGVRSLQLLHDKREAAADLAAALDADPRRIVATDLFWLPTELASLWDRKEFHLVTGSADLAELARRAAAAGEREMLIVTTVGQLAAPAAATVRNPRLPAFSVDLHVQRLGGSPEPAGDSP